METKIQPIDILQITLDRMYDAEDRLYPEFTNHTWYAMAIKDLATILGLDPDKYWTKEK